MSVHEGLHPHLNGKMVLGETFGAKLMGKAAGKACKP